jgi:hypothetical protein
MTHQRLEWPKIPSDLKAEMVNEAGFIKLLETTRPGELNQDLVETLEGFNTWDEVHLNGGLLLKGDVFGLGLGKDVDEWFAARTSDVNARLKQRRSLLSLFSNNPTEVHLSRGSKTSRRRSHSDSPSTCTWLEKSEAARSIGPILSEFLFQSHLLNGRSMRRSNKEKAS